MSRKKNNDFDIELGVVENYGIEDEATAINTSDATDTGNALHTTEAKLTFVSEGEIWIDICGFGYSIKYGSPAPWMKKGTIVKVAHEGIPGEADFKVVEIIND